MFCSNHRGGLARLPCWSGSGHTSCKSHIKQMYLLPSLCASSFQHMHFTTPAGHAFHMSSPRFNAWRLRMSSSSDRTHAVIVQTALLTSSLEVLPSLLALGWSSTCKLVLYPWHVILYPGARDSGADRTSVEGAFDRVTVPLTAGVAYSLSAWRIWNRRMQHSGLRAAPRAAS